MDISSEHEEAMRSLKDACQSLLHVMKEMPKDIDISVHLIKEGSFVRIEDLKCMIVQPLICYEDEWGYTCLRNKGNAIIRSKTKIEFLSDGKTQKFKLSKI